MAMRGCRACSRPLEPDAAPQRRYCHREDCYRERDRRRKQPAGAEVVELRPGHAGSLVDAVREALGEVNQLDSWEGRNAVSLAERIMSAGRESGSAFAALVAKLETSMALALRPRPGESFVDDLRRRRAERLGG